MIQLMDTSPSISNCIVLFQMLRLQT